MNENIKEKVIIILALIGLILAGCAKYKHVINRYDYINMYNFNQNK